MSSRPTPTSQHRGCLSWLGAVIAWATALLLVWLLAMFICEGIASRSDAARYPPRGRLVDVGGYRLHLYCTGERVTGRPTVVLEAEHGSASPDWALVQPQVAEFARVCSYDRGGYGWSDPAPSPRTSQHIASELHTLLVNAGEETPYLLVGHCLGAHVVRLFAYQHPGEVVGMVLVDARPENLRDIPVLRQEMDQHSEHWLTIALSVASRLGVQRLLGTAMLDILGRERLPDYPVVMAYRPKYFDALREERLWLALDDAHVRQIGPLGELPLVVIRHGLPGVFRSGEAESAFRESQEDLSRLSTNGRLIVAERSWRDIQTEQPEVVTNAIRQVLEAAQPSP